MVHTFILKVFIMDCLHMTKWMIKLKTHVYVMKRVLNTTFEQNQTK